MRHRELVTILLLSSALFAESGIHAPIFGYATARNGSLRRVTGVRGNLLVQDVLADKVISASFWTNGGLAKTDSELLLFNADGALLESLPAPSGPAIAGFHRNGAPAIIHFPETRETWVRESGGWTALDIEFVGNVLGATVSGGPALLVRHDRQLWRVHFSPRGGRIIREAPIRAAGERLLFLPDGRILAIEGLEATLQDASGALERIALPASADRMELAGRDTILFTGPTVQFLLRADSSGSSINILPGRVQ